MRTSFNQVVALRRFFDRYLRGMPTGIDGEAPVHYFITGADHWVAASSWPPAATATS
jgi:predicted acyl esterase